MKGAKLFRECLNALAVSPPPSINRSMATPNTHQQLARTSDSNTCPHPSEMFCINCLVHELILRRDSRYDVAVVAMLDLRRLARLRAIAKGGESWRDAWHDILDPDRLGEDLASSDAARRAAAETAQQSFGDFLQYRAWVNHNVTSQVRKELRAIERRARTRNKQMERDGVESDVGCYVDSN